MAANSVMLSHYMYMLAKLHYKYNQCFFHYQVIPLLHRCKVTTTASASQSSSWDIHINHHAMQAMHTSSYIHSQFTDGNTRLAAGWLATRQLFSKEANNISNIASRLHTTRGQRPNPQQTKIYKHAIKIYS